MDTAVGWYEWGLAAVYVAVVIGIGLRFLTRQQTAEDFFLGSRSLGWVPIAFSLTATSISAFTFVTVPATAFELGWSFLWLLLPLVFVLPFNWAVVFPRLRGKNVSTVFELLEQTYGGEVRLICCLLFLAWRLIWTAGVIYAAGRVIFLFVGGPFPEWSTILLLSLVTTLYTYLGGMRAVVWTDVVQTLVMFAGVVCIVVLMSTPSSDTANAPAGQLPVPDGNTWGLVAMVLDGAVALASLYLVDQITAQRILAARSLRDSRLGLVVHTVLAVVLLVGLGSAGVLLRQHSAGPVQHVARSGDGPAEVADSEPSRVDWEESLGPERISFDLTPNEKLLPAVLGERLAPGITAVIGLALVAAAMSTFDSAVNSLGAVIHFDLCQRFRWARRWIGSGDRSSERRQLQFAKLLTWFVGVSAGFLSLALPGLQAIDAGAAIGLLNGIAAPMFGVFLVALLGRRSSTWAACLGLVLGACVTWGLMLGSERLASDGQLAAAWGLVASFPFTLGTVASAGVAFLGSRRAPA